MVANILNLKSVLVAAVALASANAVDAQQKASIVIYNPTENPLIFEVKWPGGDWKRYTVPSRQESAHWFNLVGSERPGAPQVRFDYICGDPGVDYKTYTLDYYVVDDAFRGRTYFFRYDSTGRYLDLHYEIGR